MNDNKTLSKLNEEEVIRQIPLIIYLTVLCLCGTLGNSMVCYIFSKKYTLSTYRIFITALSVVNLLTSCVALPLQLSLQFWQYNFQATWHCKLTLFVNTWATITSGVLLLCIAFDRYRKVCKPLSWQVTHKAAKYISIVSPSVGIACSWISAIIYGVHEGKHSVYNVTITGCGVTENMVQTSFPLINNIIFAILFLGALAFIICFYCCIAVRVRKQMKWKYKPKNEIEILGNEIEMTNLSKDTIEELTEDTKDLGSIEADATTVSGAVSADVANGKKQETLEKEEAFESEKNKVTSKKPELSRPMNYRTTLIMFTVSLAFIISYLPLISLLLIRSVNKTFLMSLNDSERSAYKFFLRSYLLNSAINLLIYGILDARFRKSCKKIFSFRNMLSKMRKIMSNP